MRAQTFTLLCFFCLLQAVAFGQFRMKVNGVPYNDNDIVYINCGSGSLTVEAQFYYGSSWITANHENVDSAPSGWTWSFHYNYGSYDYITFTQNNPTSSGALAVSFNYPGLFGTQTIHLTLRATPQIYWTSTPTISSSYSSNTFSVYAATSGNVNWTAYGGIQVNGSSYSSGTAQSATISTQAYGRKIEVTASNSCGTSPALSYNIYSPYLQSTTVNGSPGSSATVSWVATLALLTDGTASGANWSVTNGSGSISTYGTSCNAYPSNFLRVVGAPTNSAGTGPEATFYIFKDGYSPYRMAYPNPTRDQLTLSFDDPIIAKELLKEVSLLDEKGKSWASFDMAAAKETDYFSQAKNITLDVKQLPTGTYYLQVQLGQKRSSERILIN